MSLDIRQGAVTPAINVEGAALAREELTRVLELVSPLEVAGYAARNRRDYDVRGNRLPSGALVIYCEVVGGEKPVERRVIIDGAHRALSEPTIEFLGAEAVQRQEIRGDYIHNTVS